MPSVIRGSDNFDTAGGNAVKAWVNFNGTGTVAIRAAHNVSSITDNGVGDYTVNFTTAMSDANFSWSAGVRWGGGGNGAGSGGNMVVLPNNYTMVSTSLRLSCYNTLVGNQDVDTWAVTIFR